MDRTYHAVLTDALARNRQMLFVSGPRQVGKTTLCQALGGTYLNWDAEKDRQKLLGPQEALALTAGFLPPRLGPKKPVLVLDELHKRSRWKAWLKGFFDTYGKDGHLVVTGSSRLDLYRRGGDSLMGRYLLFRLHPLSAAEILRPQMGPAMLAQPAVSTSKNWDNLWQQGGFPEPFVRADTAFTRQWRRLRRQQLLREDIRDLTHITETAQLEQVVAILEERSGQAMTLSSLSKEVGVTVVTIRRWLITLASFHFGFLIRPYYRGVANSLRKEPKWYLRDWSGVEDPGARAETAVACHLLKAVEVWTDLGLGDFELTYMRDKAKREVDFLVLKDRKPWFLVEVKLNKTTLSPALPYYQKQTGAPHAFQVVWGLDFEMQDPFAHKGPVVVPAKTLLSQLV